MKKFAYYNEWDKKAAAWLRELIKRGLIADGDVDERSITEVEPRDIKKFVQCYWFAGIGGWSYALQLAGRSNIECWSASLPCQPFSSAGKQLGKSDERHLLPHFLGLVEACKPKLIIGEQVSAAIRHGWLDDLCDEMEKQNYTIRADVRTAAGVGAPHKRERLYWVAYSDIIRRHGGPADTEQKTRSIARLDYNSTDDVMADSSSERLQKQSSEYGVSRQQVIGTARENFTGSGCVGNAASDNEQRNRQSGESIRQQVETGGSGISCVMVQSDSNGCEQGSKTTTTARYRSPINSTSWADPEWIYCRDNKYRPIKPGIKPMVNGVSGRVVSGGDRGTSDDAIAAQGQKETDANNTAEARVMRLKGYGNAIVPQVAAQFILDYCN